MGDVRDLAQRRLRNFSGATYARSSVTRSAAFEVNQLVASRPSASRMIVDEPVLSSAFYDRAHVYVLRSFSPRSRSGRVGVRDREHE